MAYRFRNARERAGLSTYEVAKRIGVSQPAVNQWDTGNKIPSVEMLCKLADLYCVSTDYLLGLSELRNPQTITLTDHEMLLLKAYRAADAEGQQNIIFTCQLEMRKVEKGENVSAG